MTKDIERVGLRLAMPKPDILVVKSSSNVIWGRLFGCSRSESKPEVPITCSIARVNDLGSLSSEASNGSTCLS